MNAIDIAKCAAAAANEKKAARLVIMDLRQASDLCDFQVICSGENERQTKAIAQAVEDLCQKQLGMKPVSIEGKQSGQWILLDYGAAIIHIFMSSVRDYYALESIWPNAKKIDA